MLAELPKGKAMPWMRLLLIVGMLTIALSCSGTGSTKTEESPFRQRIRLVNDYKRCMREAGEDQAKMAACEDYLRAAEAIE